MQKIRDRNTLEKNKGEIKSSRCISYGCVCVCVYVRVGMINTGDIKSGEDILHLIAKIKYLCFALYFTLPC